MSEEHVLYRHWGKDGNLLYAGRTNNPPARLADHRGEAPWWSSVSWTTYERFSSLNALKTAEAQAIEDESPCWNVQGRKYPGAPRQSHEPGLERYSPITDRDLVPELRLVHPLSREFSLYGGGDTMLRVRKWALGNRYYLLDSGYKCAHDLYRMRCPQFGKCLPGADHTQTWVPAPSFSDFTRRSGADEPFILTQPYCDALPDGMREYAAAHCLDIDSYPFDAWYNPGHCTPFRLTPLHNGHALFPLATECLSLMCAWRDDWPEEIPEWLR